MGGVDLDGIEAGFDRISRRSCPGAHHRPTLVGRELARGQPSRRDRLPGGVYRLPQPGARPDFLRGELAHAIHRALRGPLAPAMRELDADSHPLALHEGDQWLEALHLRVAPDAEVIFI